VRCGIARMDGITGISAIKALSPATHIVMLTVHDDPHKVFGAICAGASGYLLKDASEETLRAAIHEVLNGGAPMNPRVADWFWRDLPTRTPCRGRPTGCPGAKRRFWS